MMLCSIDTKDQQSNVYHCALIYMIRLCCVWLAGKFFWYLLFTLLTLLYYTFYGLLAVVLSPNLQVSSVASTLFYAIWNLFSGFLVTLPQMPVFLYPCSNCFQSPFNQKSLHAIR